MFNINNIKKHIIKQQLEKDKYPGRYFGGSPGIGVSDYDDDFTDYENLTKEQLEEILNNADENSYEFNNASYYYGLALQKEQAEKINGVPTVFPNGSRDGGNPYITNPSLNTKEGREFMNNYRQSDAYKELSNEDKLKQDQIWKDNTNWGQRRHYDLVNLGNKYDDLVQKHGQDLTMGMKLLGSANLGTAKGLKKDNAFLAMNAGSNLGKGIGGAAGTALDAMGQIGNTIDNLVSYNNKPSIHSKVFGYSLGGNLFPDGGVANAVSNTSKTPGLGAYLGAANTAIGLFGNAVGNAKIDDQNIGNDIRNSAMGITNNYNFDNLANDFSKYHSLNENLNGSDLRPTSVGGDISSALSAAGQGAVAGSAFGPWGAVVGGAVGLVSSSIGSIVGHNKAKEKAKKLNEEITRVNNWNKGMMQNKINNARMNNVIDLRKSLSSKFADGGDLHTNGADFSNGLRYINTGGTHEENPYQGVQMGVDPQGTPNLVEEGEVIWNDYVFSNRLRVPQELNKRLKLGNKEITFANAVKKLQEESEERPNDPISKRGLSNSLKMLAEAQEQVRIQEEQIKEAMMQQQLEQQQMQQQYNAMLQQQMQNPNMYNEGMQPTQEEMLNGISNGEMTYALGGNLYGIGGRADYPEDDEYYEDDKYDPGFEDYNARKYFYSTIHDYGYDPYTISSSPATFNPVIPSTPETNTNEVNSDVKDTTNSDIVPITQSENFSNYVIKKGDTLSKIAKAYGTTVPQLMKWNSSITDPNKIYAGRTLSIGSKGESPAAETTTSIVSNTSNKSIASNKPVTSSKTTKGSKSAAETHNYVAEGEPNYEERFTNPSIIERGYLNTLDLRDIFDRNTYEKEKRENIKTTELEKKLKKEGFSKTYIDARVKRLSLINKSKNLTAEDRKTLHELNSTIRKEETNMKLKGLGILAALTSVGSLVNTFYENKPKINTDRIFDNAAHPSGNRNIGVKRNPQTVEHVYTPSEIEAGNTYKPGEWYSQFYKPHKANPVESLGSYTNRVNQNAKYLQNAQRLNVRNRGLQKSAYRGGGGRGALRFDYGGLLGNIFAINGQMETLNNTFLNDDDWKFISRRSVNPYSFHSEHYVNSHKDEGYKDPWTYANDISSKPYRIKSYDNDYLNFLNRILTKDMYNSYIKEFKNDDNFKATVQNFTARNKGSLPDFETFKQLAQDGLLENGQINPNGGDSDAHRLAERMRLLEWEKAQQAAQTTTTDNTPVQTTTTDEIIDEIPEEESDFIPRTPTNPTMIPGSWWRYAPILGSGIGLMQNLLSKPDYRDPNAIQRAAHDMNDIPYTPIGGKLGYVPMDKDYVANQLHAQNVAAQRNMMNMSSGNRGAAMYNMLNTNSIAQSKLAELYKQADEYNAARKKEAYEFNKDIDKYNSDLAFKVSAANADINKARLDADIKAAYFRDAIDRAYGAERSENFNNFFDNLGLYGREIAAMNLINSNKGLYYQIDPNFNVIYKGAFDSIPDYLKPYVTAQAEQEAKDMKKTNKGKKGGNK